MKRAKKVMASLLALAMAASCLCTPAMAAAGPGGPGGGMPQSAPPDVAGKVFTDESSGTTLDLVDQENYTISGEGLEVSGTYTVASRGTPFGTLTIVTFEDLSEEDDAALRDALIFYWDGTVLLDLEAGTFEPGGDATQTLVDYAYDMTQSDESPTGYYITLTVEDDGYKSVYANGGWIASKLETVNGSETEYDTAEYAPEDWEPGMYYSGESMLPLEQGEDGNWTLTLPVASSMINILCYHDIVPEYGEANKVVGADDYTIITPYSEKQAPSYDWTVAAANKTAAGKVEYVDIDAYYTEPQKEGEVQVQLSIYTPYGYDENRTEPYPVLYLVPGGGTTYTTWYTGGMVNNVFDNLIADGVVEPTILVSMALQAAGNGADSSLVKSIIPYIEENYNASSDPADRAVIGTSMGGASVTDLWLDPDSTELFTYYGFFSGVDKAFKDAGYTVADTALLEKMKSATIAIGGGTNDFNMFAGDSNSASIYELNKWMNANGVEHTYAVKGGGHGFDTWLQLLVPFVEDYLWKVEKPAPVEPEPAPAPEPEPEPEPAPEPAPAPGPQPEPTSGTYVVAAGDSLWKIALRQYGSGSMWTVIYEANKSTIKDPNHIYVGQQLVLPSV